MVGMLLSVSSEDGELGGAPGGRKNGKEEREANYWNLPETSTNQLS